MSNLSSLLSQFESSSAQASADLDQLHRSLAEVIQQTQRAAFLAQYDQDTLCEFFAKPYVVRPIGADEYELIVPKFIGSIGGWPVRTDGAFLIFRVSRFINMINPLPQWLADELGYKATPFHAVIDGNTLDDDFISFLGKEIRPGGESIQTFR